MTTQAEPGRFGRYGGQYVPEMLMAALQELDAAYAEAKADPSFQQELDAYLSDYAGRPSPLTYAARLSELVGAKVYLKREDLNHTGAHKINNALGQALLAKRMGKKRLIAETGAGMHGTASATAMLLMPRLAISVLTSMPGMLSSPINSSSDHRTTLAMMPAAFIAVAMLGFSSTSILIR